MTRFRTIFLLALVPLLTGCGDDREPRRDPTVAGIYVLDKEAMRGPWLDAYDALVDRRLAGLPTAARRAKDRSAAAAAKTKFRGQFEALNVTLVLGADGSWTLNGAALEGRITRRGTWTLKEQQLTLVAEPPSGTQAGGSVTPAVFQDGVISMRPEPHLPEAMIFRRR